MPDLNEDLIWECDTYPAVGVTESHNVVLVLAFGRQITVPNVAQLCNALTMAKEYRDGIERRTAKRT